MGEHLALKRRRAARLVTGPARPHISRMAHPVLSAFLLAALLGAGVPLSAQQAPDPPAQGDGGAPGADPPGTAPRPLLDGLADSLRPRLEGMAREMEPALRDMLDRMGPALDGLAGLIGDLNAYHPPERLPNGDILLRRKTPLPPPAPPMDRAPPEGPVDL